MKDFWPSTHIETKKRGRDVSKQKEFGDIIA